MTLKQDNLNNTENSEQVEGVKMLRCQDVKKKNKTQRYLSNKDDTSSGLAFQMFTV